MTNSSVMKDATPGKFDVMEKFTVKMKLMNNTAVSVQYLKIYSHKTNNFKSVFLLLCSPVNLSKHNVYALYGRLKQFFCVFIAPYLTRWFTRSVWYQTAVNAHHFTPGTEESWK